MIISQVIEFRVIKSVPINIPPNFEFLLIYVHFQVYFLIGCLFRDKFIAVNEN